MNIRLRYNQMSWFQISHQFVCLGKTQACVNWTVTHLQFTYKGIWFEISSAKRRHSICISTSTNFFHTFIWRGWNGANASRYGKSGSVTIILSDKIHLITRNYEVLFKHKIIIFLSIHVIVSKVKQESRMSRNLIWRKCVPVYPTS